MRSLVLVHGLPDHSGTWEKLLPLLVPKFSKITFVGLPGIGNTDSILEYRSFDDLAKKLSESLPEEASIYVGHDFGGILGAVVAEHYPHLISQLVLINSPTIQELRAAILNNPDQAARSSYAHKIQSDPVSILSKNEFAFLKDYLFKAENNLSTEYLNSLLKMWSYENTLLNIGHYYRLILNSELKSKGKFNQPTTQIWSKGDPFLGSYIQNQMNITFPKHKYHSIAHDSHWIHCSDPTRIADILLQF